MYCRLSLICVIGVSPKYPLSKVTKALKLQSHIMVYMS